jgi:hypothetical protein
MTSLSTHNCGAVRGVSNFPRRPSGPRAEAEKNPAGRLGRIFGEKALATAQSVGTTCFSTRGKNWALLFRSGGRRARSNDAPEDRRHGQEHHEKQTRHA